jgi:hypothetical protein
MNVSHLDCHMIHVNSLFLFIMDFGDDTVECWRDGVVSLPQNRRKAKPLGIFAFC